ncbi:hypothetical protein H131_08103 [Lysinibacillus sphaericus OT4b.31]|uniref:Uncharacterized protein n=1 Tax=Lysinibacillus sphaericus OT4b.31 TaxID=1285586 RepID=R7ZFT5_LYSSH|nr:hypothetical protein H131_08103 [Lysinibacillus sphaericus OT4b.31]
MQKYANVYISTFKFLVHKTHYFLPTKCPQEQIKLNAFKWGKVEEILLNQHLRCVEFLLIK